MKTKILFAMTLLLASGFFLSAKEATDLQKKPTAPVRQQAPRPEGAYQLLKETGTEKSVKKVLTLADGFFSVAHFDLAGKKFLGTYGGTYTLTYDKLAGKYEFNTFDSTKVGTPILSTVSNKSGQWQIQTLSGDTNAPQTWVKVQERNPASPLAGAWRISGREGRDGQMNRMVAGPRKTIKILSGDRFQWIAFNSETAAFAGTGGGTYTTNNGKYTEHIEFFSRDNNRVGMDLTFDFEVKDGNWHHSGLSSTGGKVNEVWTRLNKQ